MNPAQQKQEKYLASVWRSLVDGHGATREDVAAILTDLGLAADYWTVYPPSAPAPSNETLQRQNGARSVFGRILFLLDVQNVEMSAALRRQAMSQLFSEEE